MIDTKTFKQQFLKGDKGVVMYLDAKGPKTSSYQENLKGMQVTADRRAFILDNQHTSFIQTTVPDPMTMTVTGNRFASIEKDRQNLRMRQTGGMSAFRIPQTEVKDRLN